MMEMPEHFTDRRQRRAGACSRRREAAEVEVVRGPNIKPNSRWARHGRGDTITAGTVVLKAGDNITTDHILPAGAKAAAVPLERAVAARSSAFATSAIQDVAQSRCKEQGGGVPF